MTTFDETLVLAARWALVAAAAWAAAIVLALALELLTAGRVRSTWACPPPLRRAVLAGLGLLLSGGAVGLPAVAAPPRPGPLTTLPVPERPLGAGPRSTGTPPTEVVVRRGDTLWGLATEALRPGASDADVARLVRRVHRLNRAVIGPDPDHVEPGQRLLVPHPRTPTRTPTPTREDQP